MRHVVSRGLAILALHCSLPFIVASDSGIRTQSVEAVSKPVTALQLTPDALELVIADHAGVRVEVRKGRTVSRRLELPGETATTLVFSPDQRSLLVAGGIAGESGIGMIYSWPECQLKTELPVHPETILDAAWSADSLWIATACHDGQARLIDSRTNLIRAEFGGHSKSVTGLTWQYANSALRNSQDYLITASLDQSLAIAHWNPSIPAPLPARRLNQHLAGVLGVRKSPTALSAHPMAVSWSEDQTIRFWQTDNGRMMRFARLNSPITNVSWHPNAESVTAATRDGCLWTVRAATAEVLLLSQHASPATHLIWATENELISAHEDGTITTQ